MEEPFEDFKHSVEIFTVALLVASSPADLKSFFVADEEFIIKLLRFCEMMLMQPAIGNSPSIGEGFALCLHPPPFNIHHRDDRVIRLLVISIAK